jgi:hypothetical protein
VASSTQGSEKPGFRIHGEHGAAAAAWGETVSMPAEPQSIASAISRLLPQEHRPAVINADESLVDMRATFPPGLTRKQAVEHLAMSLGVAIELRGKAVSVSMPQAPTAAPKSAKPAEAVAAAQAVSAPAAAPASAPTAAPKSAKPAEAVAAAQAVSAPAAAPASAPTVAAGEARKPTPIFSATPADGNMRRLLRRWAAEAGWTFGDEHWAIGRDIPLVASITLGSDFKAAVRTVLDSTEFTATPARACFYSNNVMRVVPRHEQCNRSGA